MSCNTSSQKVIVFIKSKKNIIADGFKNTILSSFYDRKFIAPIYS